MLIQDSEFVPFALGMQRLSGYVTERSCLADMRFLEVLDEANATFFRLLSAGNALAYGGMAMPDWVQLDCATLPSAMFGFALPRAEVPVDLWERLRAGAGANEAYDGLVPVAEFCAACTGQPATVVGFSMFSLIPGLRLGVRSKALALLCMDARTQIGVTGIEGPARRTQEVFGPLRVLCERPAVHPNPDAVVYELDVPARAALEHIVRNGRLP